MGIPGGLGLRSFGNAKRVGTPGATSRGGGVRRFFLFFVFFFVFLGGKLGLGGFVVVLVCFAMFEGWKVFSRLPKGGFWLYDVSRYKAGLEFGGAFFNMSPIIYKRLKLSSLKLFGSCPEFDHQNMPFHL